MEMIIAQWREKYAHDLSQWKKRTEDTPPRTIYFDLPQWYIDDKKERISLILDIDLARDLYPGQVMHRLKKSWLMNALIWIWYTEHKKELKDFITKDVESLKKRVPRLNLGKLRKSVPIVIDEDGDDLALPSYLTS